MPCPPAKKSRVSASAAVPRVTVAATSKRATKKSPKKAPTTVPLPKLDKPIDMGTKAGRRRSFEERLRRADKRDQRRIKRFFKDVDRVMVPQTLEELFASSGKSDLARWEDFCAASLGPEQPAIGVSTVYVDRNKQPIFAYFATRKRHQSPNKNLGLHQQYDGRTSADVAQWREDEIVEDGINVCFS